MVFAQSAQQSWAVDAKVYSSPDGVGTNTVPVNWLTTRGALSPRLVSL